MSVIRMAYALHHSPDYSGDRRPWHWYKGTNFDDLERTSAHASECAALEYMGECLLKMARLQRERAAR